MNGAPDIAVFADWENVALGARESGLGTLDPKRVTDRLLEKGRLIVRRAYSNWARFGRDRKPLHNAGFDLIDVPPSTHAGKNGADIRLVCDALDLAHHKPHLGLFCLITGDSDFSPLARKLRENGREVIGISVRSCTSPVLVSACDTFWFYDDLRPDVAEATPDPEKDAAVELVRATAERLIGDREAPVHGSQIKQAIKRKRPEFNESRYGYKRFGELLEDARQRGALSLTEHPPSGGWIVTGAEA